MATIVRPVWRSYSERFLANAVGHARAGGHAWVRTATRGRLLLPCDADGALPELTAWALLDLGIGGFDVVAEGVAAGLATVAIPARLREQVAEWCERDAREATSTTAVELDCRACAGCCRHNRVVLEDTDLDRWHEAGRGDLAGDAYVRERGRRRVLRVLASGDCVHLQGNDCGIYALRPDNCRAFPAGSEGCLSVRAERG